MLRKGLGLAFCGVVAALVANQAPALAQTEPRVAVQNQSEGLFTNFCDAFGLRDYPFANTDKLWADSVYQDARSFIIDFASKKSASGRRADAYLSKAEFIASDISSVEREGRDLMDSLFREDYTCPAGTSITQACAIGSCDFVTGVTCVPGDASSLVERKEQLLDMLVKNLDRGVSVAATTGKRKQRAKEIKSALTGLKDSQMEVRKKVGFAVFCK
jgi:hypothetical protein